MFTTRSWYRRHCLLLVTQVLAQAVWAKHFVVAGTTFCALCVEGTYGLSGTIRHQKCNPKITVKFRIQNHLKNLPVHAPGWIPNGWGYTMAELIKKFYWCPGITFLGSPFEWRWSPFIMNLTWNWYLSSQELLSALPADLGCTQAQKVRVGERFFSMMHAINLYLALTLHVPFFKK